MTHAPVRQECLLRRRVSRSVCHTHLVRGGSLMLQPTDGAACPPISGYPPRKRWVLDAPAYRRLSVGSFLHTHLVTRWVSDAPTYRPRPGCPPTSTYPPRKRWVCDASAYRPRVGGSSPSSVLVHTHVVRSGYAAPERFVVGSNSTYPLLTEWVCSARSGSL
jgi:hypothetical protein